MEFLAQPNPYYENPMLNDRQKKYGSYESNARIAQNIKAAMRASPNWEILKASQRESLELIATKIARILNGDPHNPDSWHDIGGYSELIEHELQAPS